MYGFRVVPSDHESIFQLSYEESSKSPFKISGLIAGGSGGSTTSIFFVIELETPSLSVARKLTAKVPSPGNSWVGSLSVDVPPSPKSQT